MKQKMVKLLFIRWLLLTLSAKASWKINALGGIFGAYGSENVFWHQLPRRNSEASECMRGFIEEL